ncbi:hypothetical protein J2X76_001924 [Neorhizobium sp. 2083]|uniref:DUF2735 domain-containing protein n=1 Tax=Neorhizobium sp. 2083 TaxID=2817762 RepID=UPI000DE07822|nr:DUF2735 domain-containing protein [Neorhizobium sp. 2083]MDR6816751.1 hypothetical protein [Neorhizobium sp. 2083]
MTLHIHRESATIYQFPVRPRRRLEDGRTVPTGIQDVALSIVDTSCWYHDEAVRDGEPKNDPSKPC